MLAGLTSRWTSPWSWACFRADRGLRDVLAGHVRGERPLLGDDLVERRPGDVLGDHEVRAVPVRPCRAPGRRSGARPRAARRTSSMNARRMVGSDDAVGRQHLHRHRLLRPRVLGQEHHADAVLPDAVEDLVLAEQEPLRPPVQQLHRLELGEQLLADQEGRELERVGDVRVVRVVLVEEGDQVVRGEQPALADGVEERGCGAGGFCVRARAILRPDGEFLACA